IRDDLVTGVQTCALPILPVTNHWPSGDQSATQVVSGIGSLIGLRPSASIRQVSHFHAGAVLGSLSESFSGGPCLVATRCLPSGEIGRASCRDGGVFVVGG